MTATAPEPDTADIAEAGDGWLYTATGEAASAALFAAQPSVDQAALDRWAELLESRHTRLAELDVRYLHLTVPDRLTLLHDRMGLELLRPHAAPCVRVPARAGGAPAAWVDVAGYLRQQRDRHPLFWKSDSRWSPWASFMALQLLCGRLGVEANGLLLGYAHDESPSAGDLARQRVAGGGGAGTPEPIRRYRFARRSTLLYQDALAARLAQLDADEPHTLERWEGARRGFRNDHPQAVPLRLLVFGDEHTALDTSLFGGMLAETFREVHLVLSDAIDDRLVRRLRPDVVISQVSERRMCTVPDDTIGSAERAARILAADCEQPVTTGAVRMAAAASADGVRVTTLLASERYRLDPPITTQPACVNDVNDAWMTTREVTLYDVSDARVFFNGARHLISASDGSAVSRFDCDEERERAVHWAPHRKLDGTTLVFATSAGAHCYYHWMLELLPKFGLLQRAGIATHSIDHVLVREISGAWQLETLARCGIPRERVVETVKAPWFDCERALHIDLNAGINLKMHRFVPQWMKHLYPVDARGQDRLRLYISRPPGVRRGIANEEALQPLLDAHGFTSVAMEGLSVAEQAELLSRADVVMSPHGGALTNMVFCRPGTRIVELLSRHVYPYYYGLAASCGHRYYAVLEAPEDDYPRLVNHDMAQSFAAPEFQHATHSRSFEVPLEPLARLLEQLDPRPEPLRASPSGQRRLGWRAVA